MTGHNPMIVAGGFTPPSIIEKAAKYTVSTAIWKAQGSPVRSDEEVDRLAAICEECDKFSDGKCSMCGCSCAGTKQEPTLTGIMLGAGFVNKIRRQTEDCPWLCKACGKSKWKHDSEECSAFKE